STPEPTADLALAYWSGKRTAGFRLAEMVGIRARVTPDWARRQIPFSLRPGLYLPSCQSIQWRHIGRPTRPARRQTGPLVLFGDVLQEELNRTCQLHWRLTDRLRQESFTV